MGAGAAGNLGEACSPAIFFFPSPGSSTSGVGGERKAQLILFIDEAN